jgi:rSAM/selenodomain-associated transferase 2
MAPLVSLVVPVLRDAPAVARLLRGSPPNPRVETLIVDGGADLKLDDLTIARPDVRVLRCRPGRGRQMNAGAAAASGHWLLFLHADSVLPSEWLSALPAAGSPVVGGWFRFALDDPAWQARWLERAVAWRVRLLRLPYGDQGYFVTLELFHALGGFDDIPLMEDVAFVRRLVRAGPVIELPLPLVTSARRWRADGWVRRSARNLLLVSLYFAGVRPARLAGWYDRKTPRKTDSTEA